jgi:hypothetical protein
VYIFVHLCVCVCVCVCSSIYIGSLGLRSRGQRAVVSSSVGCGEWRDLGVQVGA